MSSDMWQEKRVHEYLSSRPRLYEAGAHCCEPALIKILGARYDAAQDEMQYHCHLGRSALQGRDEVGHRFFWISRQDLLLNPEHALKLELFEANLKSPKLEGQRKKAAATPSPADGQGLKSARQLDAVLQRRHDIVAGQDGSEPLLHGQEPELLSPQLHGRAHG